MPFLSRLAHAATLLLLIVPILPADAQAPPDGTTLLVRPGDLQRIVADPWRGGAWLGTTAGLFHKDLQTGAFEHHLARSGLPSQAIHDIAPTPQAIWVATEGGVAALDRGTGQAHVARLADGSPLLHPSGTILAEGNTVWVGTGRHGLYKVDAATRVATPVPNPVNGTAFSHSIYGLAADGPDLFISVLHYGVVRWDRATGDAERFDSTYFLDEPQFKRIALSADDVWIATVGDGVVAWNRHTGNNREWASPTTTIAPSVNGLLRVGTEMWFTSPGGVSRYSIPSDSWQTWPLGTAGRGGEDLALVEGMLFAISDRSVYRFDRAANAWVGAGWWKESRTIRHNVVQSCLDEGDRLAFGTGGGGLNFLDPADGRWVRAGPEDGDDGRPRDININDVASDATTRWIATHNGVSELDRATGVYTNYYTDGRAAGEGGLNLVKDVALDGGQVWFATSSMLQTKQRADQPDEWHRGNLARMAKGTRALEIYRPSHGLSSENVTTVEPDGDRVWVGSIEGGLDVLDKGTNRLSRVFPANGRDTVLDLLLRPEGLWVVTARSGVLLVDRETASVRTVPGTDTLGAKSLGWADGLLWVGTAGSGLRAIDPAALRVTEAVTTGQPLDLWVHCMVEKAGTLYLGTGWGVHRLDLARRQMLPQVGAWTSGPTTADPLPTLLSIAAPAADAAVAAGEPFAVSGTAQGPSGAKVQVRAAAGPWVDAVGLSSWSGAVTAPAAGEFAVAARVVRDGQTLAYAARGLRVQSPAGDVPPALHHDPVLEAKAGADVRFAVRVDPAPASLVGTLHLRRPGAPAAEAIPMQASPEGLVATATLADPGDAAYTLDVRWDGGGALLPAPGAGFGAEYPLVVRPSEGRAAARLVPEPVAEQAAGGAGQVRLTVQNVGSRDGRVTLAYGGPVAAWLQGPPQHVDVPAGESRVLELALQVPAGARHGTHALDVKASVEGDAGAVAQQRVQVPVGDGRVQLAGEGGEPTTEGQGAPTAGFAWAALAVTGLAAAMRRRR